MVSPSGVVELPTVVVTTQQPAVAIRGGNVAFVDGHVNFYQDTVDIPLWRALSTYDRDEILNNN